MPNDTEKAPLPSERGYKAPWVPNSPNHAFWIEVLVGRTIRGLQWEDGKLSCFVLDDGQKVFVIKNENGEATLMIKD